MSSPGYPADYPQAPGNPELQRVFEALWTSGCVPAGGESQDWACPTHDDQRPSLGVAEGSTQAVKIKCQAGCETVDVLEAIGLNWSDIMRKEQRPDQPKSNGARQAQPAKVGHSQNNASVDEVSAGVWIYHDEHGARTIGVKRYDRSDGTKRFVQHAFAPDGSKPYHLYRLPRVLGACARGWTVLLVAGEKSVHAVLDHGEPPHTVTTTMRGGESIKWKKGYTKSLAGASLIKIVADRDKAGYKWARSVSAELQANGLTVEIYVSLTEGKKDDVVEHLAANHSIADLKLVDSAWLDEQLGVDITAELIVEQYHLTDVGNAHRLVERHGRDIRYCYPKRSWYVWNGQFWAPDDGPQIELRAKETVRHMYAEIAGVDDQDARKAFAKWCNSSESSGRIAAMVELARSEVYIAPAELNRNDWLLCTTTGVLDTKTDTLLTFEQCREEFITVQAPTPYRGSDLKHPALQKFLRTVLGADRDLAAFLQRAAYVSLTGITSDKSFINFYDEHDGNTGKSTFITCLALALGTGYSATIDPKAFTKSHKAMDSIPAELAECDGKRLVVSDEIPDGAQLNEALLKRLCSGTGVVQFRTLFTKPWQGRVTFTIWMDGNGAPRARTEDTAFWRRRKMVPFRNTIPPSEQVGDWAGVMSADPTFRAAVLAFAMRGREGWHSRGGMGTCQVVEDATKAMRNEGDPCDDYFTERVRFGREGDKEVLSVVYEDYVNWCHDHSREPVAGNTFKVLLPRKGAERIETTINVHGVRGRGFSKIKVLRPERSRNARL